MDARAIKDEILNHKCNITKLDTYLKTNFKNTIQAIINVLFDYIKKDASRNYKRIDELLNKLEDILNKLEDETKIRIIQKSADELLTRINNHLKKKKTKEIDEIKLRLQKLADTSRKKSRKVYVDHKVEVLKKVIHEERNLTRLGQIINSENSVFKSKDAKILFEDILKIYVKLNEYDSDSIYYFKVISMILSSKNRYLILQEKTRYLEILKSAKKTHSLELIINKFSNNYKVSIEELEKIYDISFDFSPRIKEMYTYPRTTIPHQNLSKMPSITIDEEGSSCIDDAISVYKNYDGTYTLRIDITSIPAVIPHMSYLDKNAYRRAETIYTQSGAISIYPNEICYNKASLLENNYRYVISYFYRIDTNFDIIEDSFEVRCTKTFISNNLSYTQADILLEKENKDDFSQMLLNLSHIASKIDSSSYGYSTINSSQMLEKFMMLPGKSLAKYFSENNYPFIYYNQHKADEKVKKDILKQYGCLRLNGIIDSIITSSEEGMYSNVATGHDSLKLDSYAKVTSPLRSYPQALCEYIIYDILINKKIDNLTLDKWDKIIKEVVPYINDRIRMNRLFQDEYQYLLSKQRIRKK